MQLLQLESNDGPILIEVSASDSAVVAANALGDTVVKLEATLTDRLRGVMRIADAFREELQRLDQIERAELEFGFALTAKGSIYVVETEAEATFKVKLSYVPRR